MVIALLTAPTIQRVIPVGDHGQGVAKHRQKRFIFPCHIPVICFVIALPWLMEQLRHPSLDRPKQRSLDANTPWDEHQNQGLVSESLKEQRDMLRRMNPSELSDVLAKVEEQLLKMTNPWEVSNLMAKVKSSLEELRKKE